MSADSFYYTPYVFQLEVPTSITADLTYFVLKVSKSFNGFAAFTSEYVEASSINFLCVLYTYLPGIEIENVADLRDFKTLFELGAYLGYLHTVFDRFENMSAEILNPDSTDPWLMSNFHLLGIEEHLENIKSSFLKMKVKKVIKEAVETFQLSQHLLKKGLIHGDFHTLNIIVDENFSNPAFPDQLSSSKQPVQDFSTVIGDHQMDLNLKGSTETNLSCLSLEKENILSKYGLIDFGEIVYSFRILEVGRLIADLMVTVLMTHYLSQHRSQEFSDFEHSLDSIQEKQNFSSVHEKCQNLDGKRSNDADKIFCKIHTEISLDVNKCLKYLFSIGRIILQGYSVSNSLSEQELAVLKHTILISLVQYIILSNNSDESSEYNLMCRQAAVILFLELCDNVKDEVFMP
ncbi:hypothetical protein Btru_034643 [Bulinus truncatus]|nr:hypothetical protein Btru_034643 [Bulinus truncatus]